VRRQQSARERIGNLERSFGHLFRWQEVVP
jgi:hypothetical protein